MRALQAGARAPGQAGVQVGDTPAAPSAARDVRAEARDALAFQALGELGFRPVAPHRVAVGGAVAHFAGALAGVEF